MKRTDLIVRWAYLFEKHNIPHETDICSLFWRVVLMTPLKLLGICVCFVPLFVLPVMEMGWWGLLMAPGVVAAIFAILFVFVGIGNGVVLFREKAKSKGFCKYIELK